MCNKHGITLHLKWLKESKMGTRDRLQSVGIFKMTLVCQDGDKAVTQQEYDRVSLLWVCDWTRSSWHLHTICLPNSTINHDNSQICWSVANLFFSSSEMQSCTVVQKWTCSIHKSAATLSATNRAKCMISKFRNKQMQLVNFNIDQHCDKSRANLHLKKEQVSKKKKYVSRINHWELKKNQ